MRKIFIVVVLLVIASLTISCGHRQTAASSKFVDLKDSASYAMGVMLAQQYITEGADTIMNRTLTLNGFVDVMNFDTCLLTQAELTEVVSAYSQQIITTQYGSVREEGEKFLSANITNTGIIQTVSGLQYKVEKDGNGIDHPSITDNIVLRFEGKKIDGTVFGTSGDKENIYNVSSLPRGLAEGVLLMTPGAKYTFYLPYYLAFGEAGYQIVEPFSTVIFEVELIEIKKN